MSSEIIARVAVSAAIFSIDKPYDYSIPEDIRDAVKVGVRVMVSFGRGKNKCEGMVMALEEKEPGRRLKSICAVLDDAPILGDADLRLAVWLRGQCFATLYDVFRAMLPSGLWYKFRDIYIAQSTEKPENSKLADAIWACPKGLTLEKIAKLGIVDFEHELQKLTASEAVVCKAGASRNVGDKTVKIAHLAAEKEEAEEYLRLKKAKAPARAKIIEYLLNNECTSVKELCYFTGASAATVAALEREGLVSISERLSFRRPKIRGLLGGAEITLNPEQEAAYNSLAVKLDEGKPACSLLYGVTGSGKTPIYVKLVQKAIDLGRESIVLVPEIALTPQLVERFYGYFGDKIAILHSALSVGERFDEWKRIRSGEVSVVVGTRSAVFAPLKKIGLIVIDEEQEHTYKSSGSPRYHAREVAKFRAVQSGALMVLGSATPSVESMYYARSGVYSLHTICARYNKQALPKVIICDMREELRAGNAASIGGVLKSELSSNIEKGEQSILFINRRGTARYCMCTGCGYVPECPNCSASLTYHAANERLMCHHCAFSIEKSQKCPECGGEFKYVGVGTQHVEHELAEQFPNTRVIRMDYDTTSAKSSHDELLRRFEREKIPIMIGTQMITKGLDFENVTLVGVLAADMAMYNDDFRANERAFALITQVVGRAGRGDKLGRAVIQTFSPNHELIADAARQDYDAFYKSEINLRKMRGLPPFRDIINLIISGPVEDSVLRAALRVAGKLKHALDCDWSDIEADVLGPAPAGILKVNNKYRYTISVCSVNTKRLRDLISRILCDFRDDKGNRNITIVADVNSVDF